jgi:hypothetical protein
LTRQSQRQRRAWEEKEQMESKARGPAGAKCKDELKEADRVGDPIGAANAQNGKTI